MQRSTSKKLEQLLDNYAETQRLIRELEKQQKDARTVIINQMRESALSCGDYVAILTECTRSRLDKDRVLEEYGPTFFAEFFTVTEYKKLEIKKAA